MINDDMDICEKCGADIREYREGHTCGCICDTCGWGWATSYFEPFETDLTKYSIVIFGNQLNAENIKVISKITGENYLKTRNMLSMSEATVFDGKATEIMDVRKILSEAHISFKITPDFPY